MGVIGSIVGCVVYSGAYIVRVGSILYSVGGWGLYVVWAGSIVRHNNYYNYERCMKGVWSIFELY